MVYDYKPTVQLPQTEADWLKARLSGIGASEASAIVGCNPYMSNQGLWCIKTGRKTAEDISSKDCVRYGHEAEGPLRELFALDYADRYRVSYGGAYDMVSSTQYPWLFATLDGRLDEIDTGRHGVLEVKTTEILRSMQREKWQDAIPQNYYVQILHQLLATGFEFSVLTAQLKTIYDGSIECKTKRYFIERSEITADLDSLLEQEIRFWAYVQEDRQPPLVLPEI